MSGLFPPEFNFVPIPGQIDIKLLICDYVFIKNNAKKVLELQLDRKIDTASLDRLKSFITMNNHRHKETFIDFNQNIENNPQWNNEKNDNAVPENKQKIQDNIMTEEEKKQKLTVKFESNQIEVFSGVAGKII